MHLCYEQTDSMHQLKHSCLTFQLHETFTGADSNRMHARPIPPPSPLPTESKESAYLEGKKKRENWGLFKQQFNSIMYSIMLHSAAFCFTLLFPPLCTYYIINIAHFSHIRSVSALHLPTCTSKPISAKRSMILAY